MDFPGVGYRPQQMESTGRCVSRVFGAALVTKTSASLKAQSCGVTAGLDVPGIK